MFSLNEMFFLKKKVLVYFLMFFVVLLDKKIVGIYGFFFLIGLFIYDWIDKL